MGYPIQALRNQDSGLLGLFKYISCIIFAWLAWRNAASRAHMLRCTFYRQI
jgi:hypothetical protein